MTSAADAYTFDFSTSLKNQQPVYTSKQWSYQIDQNNGSYQSKQIVFDLSGFYNSQRFINPQEMFIALPVVSTLTGGGNSGTTDGLGAGSVAGFNTATGVDALGGANNLQVTDQFAFGFKSGYWNLIHSIQIQVDGKDIIQLTPYINYLASFEAITTWSNTDVAKYGAIEGFLPDKSDSWNANLAGSASTYGIGVCNNTLPPANQVPLYPYSDPSAVHQRSTLSALYGAISSTATSSQESLASANDAFYKRMQTTNVLLQDATHGINPAIAGLNSAGSIFRPTYGQKVTTLESTKYALDNYMISEAIAPVASVSATGNDSDSRLAFRQLFTTCVVKFKSFCNLFEKLPLTRGLYMRIIMNMNTGNMIVGTNQAALGDVTAANPLALANFPYYTGITSSTFPNTCPLMLSPLVASGLVSIPDAVATNPDTAGRYPNAAGVCVFPGIACDRGTISRSKLILSCSISVPDPIHAQNGLTSSLEAHPLQNCRVYAPIIDMEPELVSQYISQYKQQAVYYRDALWFITPRVTPSSTFNSQVGNGFVNLQRLVIMPFYHDDTLAASSSLPICPFEPSSPWSSAPATVAPKCDLVDFNVLVSNMNIFQRNINYSFEHFLEEMGLCNAINGGLDTGLTSGLIDYYQWQNNYRYYVVDLSRRLAGDNTPKSLTVIGKNASLVTVDYFYFLQYRRHLTIDIETGHITVSSN